jgi:ABC-type phosphate/phosphonate transport system substrate-binding protein
VIARKGIAVENFPLDAQGMSIAFTHPDSTTGWLAVYAHCLSQGVDPDRWFRASAVNQHAENELAVAAGAVDLATDSEANRTVMVQRGEILDTDVPVVWISDALPMDPIAVREGLDPVLGTWLQQALLTIHPQTARCIPMPGNYSGFVRATDESYRAIHDAAALVTARGRGTPLQKAALAGAADQRQPIQRRQG